jgi:hypothetical protein
MISLIAAHIYLKQQVHIMDLLLFLLSCSGGVLPRSSVTSPNGEPDLLRLVRSAWRSFRVEHSVLAIVGRPGVPEGRARRPGDVAACRMGWRALCHVLRSLRGQRGYHSRLIIVAVF